MERLQPLFRGSSPLLKLKWHFVDYILGLFYRIRESLTGNKERNGKVRRNSRTGEIVWIYRLIFPLSPSKISWGENPTLADLRIVMSDNNYLLALGKNCSGESFARKGMKREKKAPA